MKISIGMRLQDGAWGGGNQFARVLGAYLEERGVRVREHLMDRDNDIILLGEPDARLKISAYSHRDILKHLIARNRQAIVVHRFNNTSEARDDPEKTFNKFRVRANKIADHSVFVSRWVYDRYVESGFSSPHYSVILNGGDADLWRPVAEKVPPERLRIVTHHWSTHPNKGFDIYQQLDRMLGDDHWSSRLEFTFIGRLPEGVQFQNVRYLDPLSGEALARELAQHDLYLTASRQEAGPNHIIEGAMCGLPVLYIESGAMPEYAAGYGIGFTPENFEAQLEKIIAEQDQWQAKMPEYPYTAERMCQQYYELFQQLLDQRDTIRKRRTWWMDPQWLYQTWRYRPI